MSENLISKKQGLRETEYICFLSVFVDIKDLIVTQGCNHQLRYTYT